MEQIAARGGGIEISVERGKSESGIAPTDLMWRVRVYSVTDDDMVVEQPGAAGRGVQIAPGTPLVGVMSVGQNRWMFHSRVLGASGVTGPGRLGTLKLAMPEKMERCIRREFLRISTAELRLPDVECWPLLEPASVVAAEAANRERILDLQRPLVRMRDAFVDDLLPEVGPKFGAKLVNVGGGGVGLLVMKDEAAAATKCRLIWLRVHMKPEIPAPMAMTAKIVHTHLDSSQNLYVGAAFDFDFNPTHREFVIDQIARYANLVQMARKAA
ncbi:hypothetical protein PHYC_00176 [Phycisphaerales bacterium]|nr:hypothetical protein PHYC_00176 [Phycisphaerales bacterium]